MIKKILFLLFLLQQIITFAQEIKFGKVSKEELQEQFYPLDSTADAAFLFRNRRTYYKFNNNKGSFDVVTEIHNRIKIYNKKGFKKATIKIHYYNPDSRDREKVSSLEGYTFNMNSGYVDKVKLPKKDIFIDKKNKYWSIKKLTLPNVKVGSVLDIKYKIISPLYYKIDDLEYQFDIPVKRIDYKIKIPEFYNFRTQSRGYFHIVPKQESKISNIRFTSKERIGYNVSKTTFTNHKIEYRTNIQSYKIANVPALKNDEPFVSNINNYRGGLKFELMQTNFIRIGGRIKSYSTSWESVSRQIFASSSFGNELDKTNYYKKQLAPILAASKTDSDKIWAIFQFVKSQVKWNGFNGIYAEKGVKKAYKEKIGNVADINLMLTSMLRFAGLKANPVLLSTRKNGVPLFPTIDGFNYVIAMVELSDGYILLDATEPFSAPNILPIRALNWEGRLIKEKGFSSWIKLNSKEHSLEDNMIMVKISEDHTVNGLMRSRLSNLNALSFRNQNNLDKEDELISKFEEENKIEIENFKLINKYKISKPISRTIKFSSQNLIEEINKKIYVEPLLFLTKHKNPFKLDHREFPVDFAAPWKEVNKISIEIPKGYKVEKLPEPFAIALPNDIGIFKYQVTQMGNKIKTTSILQFNFAIILPKNYLYLKDFYGKLVKKQSEKIVLVKE